MPSKTDGSTFDYYTANLKCVCEETCEFKNKFGGDTTHHTFTLPNKKKSATSFLRLHGRGLEEVHRRLLNPIAVSNPHFCLLAETAPSDPETINNDLVWMLSNRFPAMDLEVIQNEVRKVVRSFGSQVESPSSSSPSRSSTTPATSPDPILSEGDIFHSSRVE